MNRFNNILIPALLLFAVSQLVELISMWLFKGSYSALCSWDCGWYTSIVRDGYDLVPFRDKNGDAANWEFFPILPLAAYLLKVALALSPEVALIVTGKLFFLASIFAFIQFCRAYNLNISPVLAAAVVALNPYGIYGNTGYTEAPYLFMTCVTFCLLKQRRYIMSGSAGAFLGATRFVGITFLLSYLIGVVRDYASGRKIAWDIALLGFLLAPLGLALFMLFLYLHTGDALAFYHVEVAWSRHLRNPLGPIAETLHGGRLYLLWFSMIVMALAFSLVLVLQRRIELAASLFFCAIIPLSTGVWSIPRYLWWQAPLLLVLAECIAWRRLWLLVLPLFIGWSFYMYSLWFGRNDIVI